MRMSHCFAIEHLRAHCAICAPEQGLWGGNVDEGERIGASTIVEIQVLHVDIASVGRGSSPTESGHTCSARCRSCGPKAGGCAALVRWLTGVELDGRLVQRGPQRVGEIVVEVIEEFGVHEQVEVAVVDAEAVRPRCRTVLGCRRGCRVHAGHVLRYIRALPGLVGGHASARLTQLGSLGPSRASFGLASGLAGCSPGGFGPMVGGRQRLSMASFGLRMSC